MSKRGILMIISGPSGVGKSTIADAVLSRNNGFSHVPTATTRNPRPGEKHGVDYFFLSQEEFESKIQANEFFEHIEYAGNRYGSLVSAVDASLDAGNDVLLVIDVRGAISIKKLRPDAVTVFVLPPRFSDLKARLGGRGTDDEDTVSRRVEIAKTELNYRDRYDYQVINDVVERAADDVEKIRDAERLRSFRNEFSMEE